MRKNSYRSLLTLFFDSTAATTSLLLALFLRLGQEEWYKVDGYLFVGTSLFTLICAVIFYFNKLHLGVWRYTSIKEVSNIFKSVLIASMLFLPALFLYNRLEFFPRSVLVINFLLLVFIMSAPRFLRRALHDKNFSLAEDNRIPVLLVGINQYSELFLREASSPQTSNYRIVGIVDENKNQRGRYIHNTEILGSVKSIPHILKRLRIAGEPVQKVIISPEYLSGEHVENIVKIAQRSGLTVATLPRISEFNNPSQKRISISPIAIEDLLGRPQSPLNKKLMEELLNGRRVLVTGAGGSIGSEITRQIAGFGLENLALIENSEFALYKIDCDLRNQFPGIKFAAYIADVRDKTVMEKIFSEFKPEVIFHAAAIKHVPIAEENPEQAILTNVLGTKNIAELSRDFSAKAMILISTDKAVNPTNVMGASKRAAEILIQNMQREKSVTKFMMVRFGNVLGSSGSVVPLFQSQIENRQALTVTHKDMTRYFMTIREAVELVITASALGIKNSVNGIFVLDMGRPVKIYDLAVQMIKLSGLRLGKDIEIKITGIRPGEKLYEELFYGSEKLERIAGAQSIMFSKTENSVLLLEQEKITKLIKSAQSYDKQLLLSLLKELANLS